MNFSQRLTTIMEKSHISAYKMAVDLNSISEAMIGKWKNGRSLPSFENIILLSNYLGVSCDYLLTGSETISTDNNEITELYNKLDEGDQREVIGYIKGMLHNEKYSQEAQKLA